MTDEVRPLPCEHYRCTNPAKVVKVERAHDGESSPRAFCGVHGRRSPYLPEWGQPHPITPDERTTILVRLDAARAVKDAERARKNAEAEVAHAKRVAEAWEDLRSPFTSTLVIEERPRWSGAVEYIVSIRIHRAGVDHQRSWDVTNVELRDSEDFPTYVRTTGGSPNEMTPSAARELAFAIDRVAEWAEALNS